MTGETTKKFQLLLTMVIFGTIGLFVRNIALPSSAIAFVRGLVGSLCLVGYLKLKGRPVGWSSIRANARVLVLAGAAMGFNWILLFEAYRYTTVATATLAYYMAPILVILASVVSGKERLTVIKGICVALALTGMVLVSGLADQGTPGAAGTTGILLGLGAAVLYASVILLNRRLHGIDSFDATMVQLATAALVLLPYVLLTETISSLRPGGGSLVFLALVAVVHTGVAYVLYFGSIHVLKAQTVAIYSYLDPLVAVILSAVLLKEGLSLTALVGGSLILGSTFLSEVADRREAARTAPATPGESA